MIEVYKMTWFRLLFFLLLLISTGFTFGQAQLFGENHIYQTNIKSVKFHLNGLPLTQPIIGLNSSSQLQLRFDDLDGDTKNYIYSVEHCNADWSPSSLDVTEYLVGFNTEEIRNLDFSEITRRQFTHYFLNFPNNEMGVTKSGNYLLHVFNDDTGEPVITRRFMVVDTQIGILAEFKNPIDAGKVKTHQRIDLRVNYEDSDLSNPMDNVTASIYQNGNWDRSMLGLKPIFDANNELQFSPQDQIVFPAGKEFRYVDTRSIRYRSERVEAIEEYGDGYVIFVEKDKNRYFRNYFSDEDINGQFIIGTNDRNNQMLNADYVWTNFVLESESPFSDGSEVYVTGNFSDYQCRPENRLVYNPEEAGYSGEILLKQGVYNYLYTVMQDGNPDHERLEGNYYETENEYTILIYFRKLSDRYDQLVGARTVQSFTR